MVDSNNKRKKKTITEGDIATLLQRYDMTTILRLLQEVDYYLEIKMDWSELVKKTTTEITNARECQLLWRHLSRRDPLLPVDDDAQPQDDDSDLECELEASPAVSFETSTEAIAHVKVLAASYVPSKSDIPDESIEAPLTINIPYRPPEGTQEPLESPWSSRGMNITFPVCLQKATSTEGLYGISSAGTNMAFRRKRKKWSAEEDEELIAAVKRCGEGNWANIVKGDFRGERTACQLSQRWALIRRRCDTTTSVSQSGVQRSEAQMAVNHALYLAVGNRASSKKHAVRGISRETSSCSITEMQANEGSSSQGQKQSQPVVEASSRVTTSVPSLKSRVSVKKSTASSTSRLDLMVTANSVAAAACMSGVTATVPKTEPGKTAAHTPNFLPRKNLLVHISVGDATNQNLVGPLISEADSQSKSKCEVNNKVGSVIKVSNVCGKPPQVATVAGTGQGV